MNLLESPFSGCAATIAALLVALAVGGCTAQDYTTADAIPDHVREAVRAAVDEGGRPAVVIGLLNEAGEHYYAYGTAEAGRDIPVSEHTTFAIGSLTKLFTAQLLARQVIDGAVGLDTSLADLWDELEADGNIPLWQLASHRAGLPRDIPPLALQKNEVGPLLALLREIDGSTDDRRYSNAGMALLGVSLAQQAGMPLSTLMRARVLRPLNLGATGYIPDPATLASPHRLDEVISDQRPITVDVAHGAGGLHSSARDLMQFAKSHLNPPSSLEADVVSLLLGDQAQRRPSLGWQIHQDGELVVYHHGGDANGYQGFIGLVPASGIGVVLLTNSSADDELKSIALHLLDPQVPLPRFDQRSALALEEAVLRRYAGRYVIVDDPSGNTIRLEVEDHHMIYIEYGPDGALVRRSRLYAEDERHLVLREIPVRLTFEDGTPQSAALEFGDTRLLLRPQEP